MSAPEREALHELGALVRSARALAELLEDGEAYQWSASPTKGAPQTEGGRPVGGPPADPTADTAADPRRLRLREEVEAAHTAMQKARKTVEVAGRRLTRALDAWAGAGE